MGSAPSNVLNFQGMGVLTEKQSRIIEHYRQRIEAPASGVPCAFVSVVVLPTDEVSIAVAEVEPEHVASLQRGLKEISDALDRYLATSRLRGALREAS